MVDEALVSSYELHAVWSLISSDVGEARPKQGSQKTVHLKTLFYT